ncbi:MAG: immunoglobulin domain-containing protein [Ignavibacteriae bacterium]|nr:immunoglobulin domain-containing protein [Ignavibacteriota bacterium]
MKKLIFLYAFFISTILISQTTPVITIQPQDQTVDVGETAIFNCEFTGPTNKGYQWYRTDKEPDEVLVNNSKISGATSSTLTVQNVTLDDDGAKYKCETKDLDFYSANGSWVDSRVAKLLVNGSFNNEVILLDSVYTFTEGGNDLKYIYQYSNGVLNKITKFENINNTWAWAQIDNFNSAGKIISSFSYYNSVNYLGAKTFYTYFDLNTIIETYVNLDMPMETWGHSSSEYLYYNNFGKLDSTRVERYPVRNENPLYTKLTNYTYNVNESLTYIEEINLTNNNFQSSTQTNYYYKSLLLDSIVVKEANSSKIYYNKLKEIYFYESNGNNFETEQKIWENDTWINNWKEFFGYDSNQNNTLIQHSNWNGNSYSSDWREEKDYNTSNKLIRINHQVYNESWLSEWIISYEFNEYGYCSSGFALNGAKDLSFTEPQGRLLTFRSSSLNSYYSKIKIEDTSDYWNRDLQVSDNTNNLINLTFGQANTATDDIDESLGESELPPPPPLGTFDARFVLSNNKSTMKDNRNSSEEEIVWKIQFQPGSSGYPITLNWNKGNLPFGSFFLKDAITGQIVNVDMKLSNSFSLTNEAINKLNIVYKEEFTSTISVNKEWDLVSVPLKTENMELASIFNETNSNAFLFDGIYKSTPNLENGKGYWVKFNQENITNIYGQEPTESIQVKKGWNMIGGYNDEIPISSLSSNPNGIISSNIYGFDNGYYISDKLKPGDGYWVKASNGGELNFSSTNVLSKTNTSKKLTDTNPFLSIPILAVDGVSDTIHLNVGLDSLATNGLDLALGEEELPPLPPLGVFDIRFTLPDTNLTTYSDYRFTETKCIEHIINFQLGDSSEGLTLSWNLPEGVTLNISDMFGGSIFSEQFESGKNSFTITNTEVNNAKLILCYSNIILSNNDIQQLPNEYSLSQNYPNPFNPTTTIQYAIPTSSNLAKEGLVTLKIYDVLGREIATLVNEKQNPGIYTVQFDATKYSSGIYFYRLQAGDYVQTNKMVLMK